MIRAVHPLPLFNYEAPPILCGRQTIVRRVKKEERFPFGGPGSILWLQEALCFCNDSPDIARWRYEADMSVCPWSPGDPDQGRIPAPLMPRVLSRGCVIIDEWWDEPVQNITRGDIKREDYRDRFAYELAWDRRYPHAPFSSNPDTWAMYITVL